MCEREKRHLVEDVVEDVEVLDGGHHHGRILLSPDALDQSPYGQRGVLQQHDVLNHWLGIWCNMCEPQRRLRNTAVSMRPVPSSTSVHVCPAVIHRIAHSFIVSRVVLTAVV